MGLRIQGRREDGGFVASTEELSKVQLEEWVLD